MKIDTPKDQNHGALVIEGPCGNGLGERIASNLDYELCIARHNVLPDGESEVGIDANVNGKNVIIVQSTFPNQDKCLIELMILADEARINGASKITAVIPYLAYAREDQKYKVKSNAVSIDAILHMLGAAGITAIVTAAPHKIKPLSSFAGDVSIADAIVPLIERVKEDIEDPFVLAPDKGASEIAKHAAQILNCDYAVIGKQRDKITGEVSILNKPDVDIKRKNVVIVDDMIATGSTTATAAEFARAQGAKSVVVAAVHLLLVKDARERLKNAGISEIYGTNTIRCDTSKIADISEFLSAACVKKNVVALR